MSAIPKQLTRKLLTSFIGREKEIAEVKEELNSHRLVTSSHPGERANHGSHCNWRPMLDAYPHGIWS
ncbi:MAG: hypothetical protein IPN96_12035 [Anaerolineales bacterium]|nr:hypothetical protein [Anaerolineales bacterium]